MHSSRMCTTCLLTISCSIPCISGMGVCIVSRRGSVSMGVCIWGVCIQGGLHLGVCIWGSASWGVSIQVGWAKSLPTGEHFADPLNPPLNRQTGVKTLPCSKLRLWVVKTHYLLQIHLTTYCLPVRSHNHYIKEPTVNGRQRKAFSNLQSCLTDSS